MIRLTGRPSSTGGLASAGEADDHELLEAWGRGDGEAGGELLRRHFHRVYRMFAGKVEEGVDDLVQRTFLLCMERRDRLSKGLNLRAYILAMARNVLLHHFRDQKRRPPPKALIEGNVPQLGSVRDALVERQEHRILLLALRRLPLDLQIALELHYWEELPLAEIAVVLEVPLGTVKSRLFRARQALREEILAVPASADLHRSSLDDLDGWARSLRGYLGDGTGA